MNKRLKELFEKINFRPNKKNFYFIQITDLHIGDKSYEINEELIEEIRSFNPKPLFIVLTGDNLINKKKEYKIKYEEIVSKLASISTTKIITGNHDVTKGNDYSFKLRNINFFFLNVCSKPLYKLNPHSSGGYLDKKQIKWLSQNIEKCKEKEIVIFIHHPPIDYEAHLLRIQLEKIFLSTGKNIWIICGHVHENLLFRRLLPDGKTWINIIITPIAKEGYRIFVVEKGKIKRSILRDKNKNFEIDPIPEEYLFYTPAFEGVKNIIFSSLYPEDEKYILKIKGGPWGKGEPWGEESHRRLYGKDGILIYKINLKNFIIGRKLKIAFAIAHGYKIELSSDLKKCEIEKIGEFEKEGVVILPIPQKCIEKGVLYVKIKNFFYTPEQIHPTAVRGFAIIWEN